MHNHASALIRLASLACALCLSPPLLAELTFPRHNFDFYISREGNDNWAGHLAAPNANHTDGPFATLEKAK